MKKVWKYLVWLLVICGTLAAGVFFFQDRRYDLVAILVMVLTLVPFLLRFEGRKPSAPQITLIAVMSALSILGRLIFAPFPFFKPVTAIVVITGLYLGPDAGFLCGAVTAVVTNIYFGQGPWTPFQMVTWGAIGLIAGWMAEPLKKHMWATVVYGLAAGFFYSLVLDVWDSMWWDGTFSWPAYITSLTTSLPVTAIYAVSNAIFLLILAKPLGRKLEHTLKKWG